MPGVVIQLFSSCSFFFRLYAKYLMEVPGTMVASRYSHSFLLCCLISWYLLAHVSLLCDVVLLVPYSLFDGS